MEEGILLRRQGVSSPIQLLGVSAPGTEDAVIAHELCPNIFTVDSARRLAERAKSLGKTLPFHLKLDTGMGRIGIRPEELAEFLETLNTLPNLNMEGVFSHFSKAADVTDIDGIKNGDDVILLGTPGNKKIHTDEMAVRLRPLIMKLPVLWASASPGCI